MSTLRFPLFLLSIALAVLGSLTLFKSPDWSKWEFALLAGEFGYYVVIVPFVVGVLALLARRGGLGCTMMTFTFCALSAALFLLPIVQARRLALGLPARLARELGPAEISRAPFSLAALWQDRPEPVPAETLKYNRTLSLDFYRAQGRSGGAAPCVVLVHGGGWDSGSRDEIPHFDHWLARRGYAVAAISYRLAPQFHWPAPRDDIKDAIKFLKAHAAELGIDPARFVLLGRSAGGQLAEATAYGTRMIMETLRACPDKNTAACPAELPPPTTITSSPLQRRDSMGVAP